MEKREITFFNKAEIRVQAQIFAGPTLISTCLADPGESRTLPAETVPYDIFLKHGGTGRELARKLDSEDKTVTLTHQKGRYTIS